MQTSSGSEMSALGLVLGKTTFVPTAVFWEDVVGEVSGCYFSVLLDSSFSDRNVCLVRKKRHRKKGIVQCESCVYYIAVMSGLNCFLIVCFCATIVFPCLSFLFVFAAKWGDAVCREEWWNEDHFWG